MNKTNDGKQYKPERYAGWDEAVEEYFSSKKSLSTIGRERNVNSYNLRNYIIRKGLKLKTRGDRHINLDDRKEALKMYNDGVKMSIIADRFNVCTKTVNSWVKFMGQKPLRFEERIGITQEKRNEAIRLYTQELLNCCQIAKILKVSNRSVLDWVKEVKRTHSQIMAKVVMDNGSVNVKSLKGVLNTKFGNIYYNSSYERDRIKQLELDESVLFVNRCMDLISYELEGKTRLYNPDLYVQYVCGKKCVEEIKPFAMINKLNNRIKISSAKSFYKESDIIYKVVTEKIIYGKNAKI